MFICGNRKCRKSQSIFTNSWFEKDKIQVNEILEIYYYWLLKMPSTSIAITIGKDPSTIGYHLSNIRNLIGSHIQEHKQKIGGKDII
ncbi:10461_t:CDS:1, partial [Dentiscutata erythropus]